MLLDQRQHLLARGGGDGADDVSAAAIADQAARAFQIGGEIGMRIEEHRLDTAAAGLAIIVEGKVHAVEGIATHGAVRPGRRIENADLHRVQLCLPNAKKTHNAVSGNRGVVGPCCPLTDVVDVAPSGECLNDEHD